MPGGLIVGPDLCNAQNVGFIIANENGTGVTSGTYPTFSAWTQLIAATVADTVWASVTVGGGANQGSIVRIGVGAGGGEKIIGTFGFTSNDAATFNLPLSIPAGSRVSFQATAFNAQTVFASLTCYDGAFPGMDGNAGVDLLALDSAFPPFGLPITYGAAGAYGTWVQVIAATARDYIGLYVNPAHYNTGTQFNWVNIGIGAGGSEQVIIANVNACDLNTSGSVAFASMGKNVLYVPVSIKAGTRIAAQALTAAASGNLALYIGGVYQ